MAAKPARVLLGHPSLSPHAILTTAAGGQQAAAPDLLNGQRGARPAPGSALLAKYLPAMLLAHFGRWSFGVARSSFCAVERALERCSGSRVFNAALERG